MEVETLKELQNFLQDNYNILLFENLNVKSNSEISYHIIIGDFEEGFFIEQVRKYFNIKHPRWITYNDIKEYILKVYLMKKILSII